MARKAAGGGGRGDGRGGGGGEREEEGEAWGKRAWRINWVKGSFFLKGGERLKCLASSSTTSCISAITAPASWGTTFFSHSNLGFPCLPFATSVAEGFFLS